MHRSETSELTTCADCGAEMTPGRERAYSFGEESALCWACAVRRGGTAVVVGIGRMQEKIEFTAFELFFAEKKLVGSLYGSANVRVDYPRLLRLWKQGKLDLEGMITRRIPLEEINDAFRAMQAGEVIRSVVEF